MQLAALRGCTALEGWDWQSTAIANPTPTPQAQCERYGDGRGLTEQQAIAVQHLAWPQSYEGVIGRLGYPDCRAEDSDLYRLPSGYIAQIHYEGRIATSITLLPRQDERFTETNNLSSN
jgi:hypothetical protein